MSQENNWEVHDEGFTAFAVHPAFKPATRRQLPMNYMQSTEPNRGSRVVPAVRRWEPGERCYVPDQGNCTVIGPDPKEPGNTKVKPDGFVGFSFPTRALEEERKRVPKKGATSFAQATLQGTYNPRRYDSTWLTQFR